ncbi:MAG: tetratricopeptide repeat protein [Candidatus Calescibacterium sp.]|nr:tetratricopeptide repeat protein [Candidatus Calescibacterium sp.]MDW8132740.1 tetratricopeptide repeat protein [Candidatus Calescibacterium sp.]
MRILIFLILFIFNFVFADLVEIKGQLLSPSSESIITRHPQIIIKYPADISPVIKADSLRFLVNNVDYTNYVRLDLTTPEIVLFFYSVKPLNLGRNSIKVTGKLINDDIFENTFHINVNPSLSKEVSYYLGLIGKTKSNIEKSMYYYNLGSYYEKNGYQLDALSYYEQAIKLDKSNKKAKQSYDRIISLFPSKAMKLLNIVFDVSMVDINVLKRNSIYLFRCVIENYRDSPIEFNLDNFLIVSGNNYYQPLKNPVDYLRKMAQRGVVTLDDFAISNYLLSKDIYYFEYPDSFIVNSYSQVKVDLMFHTKGNEKEIVLQFFKPLEKAKKRELPAYFKLSFSL